MTFIQITQSGKHPIAMKVRPRMELHRSASVLSLLSGHLSRCLLSKSFISSHSVWQAPYRYGGSFTHGAPPIGFRSESSILGLRSC